MSVDPSWILWVMTGTATVGLVVYLSSVSRRLSELQTQVGLLREELTILRGHVKLSFQQQKDTIVKSRLTVCVPQEERHG